MTGSEYFDLNAILCEEAVSLALFCGDPVLAFLTIQIGRSLSRCNSTWTFLRILRAFSMRQQDLET